MRASLFLKKISNNIQSNYYHYEIAVIFSTYLIVHNQNRLIDSFLVWAVCLLFLKQKFHLNVIKIARIAMYLPLVWGIFFWDSLLKDSQFRWGIYPTLSILLISIYTCRWNDFRKSVWIVVFLLLISPDNAVLEDISLLRAPTTDVVSLALSWLNIAHEKIDFTKIKVQNYTLNVAAQCASIISIRRAFSFTILISLLPVFRKLKLVNFLPILSIFYMFTVNSVRILVLILIRNYASDDMFTYFHMGLGTHIFAFLEVLPLLSILAVLLKMHKNN
jgi:exosortase/archaeosortase family protein